MRARAVSLMAVLATAALAAGCGGAGSGSAPPAAGTRTIPTTTSTTPATHGAPTARSPRRSHRVRRHRPPGPPPGTLPQTSQEPTALTAAFQAEMRAVWRAVRSGNPRAGLSAFFPEAAYLQVKTVGDPAADWRYRLVGDFDLDVAAAHALLGAGAPDARYLETIVAAGDAHWVPPGVCDNRLGYWEVPNSRMVYREGGVVRSFGIASLISWRGVWYVVHLGAVVRSSASGMVDDPQTGTGAPVASSTC